MQGCHPLAELQCRIQVRRQRAILVSPGNPPASYLSCSNDGPGTDARPFATCRYAAGATIQILLFGILAIEIKRKAPRAHTMLEIIRARWGTTAHIVRFCLSPFATLWPPHTSCMHACLHHGQRAWCKGSCIFQAFFRVCSAAGSADLLRVWAGDQPGGQRAARAGWQRGHHRRHRCACTANHTPMQHQLCSVRWRRVCQQTLRR